MSVTLTNAEKQARYRERHLGVGGKNVRVGLNLNAGTRAKMGRLARHRGYTITVKTVTQARGDRREFRRVTNYRPRAPTYRGGHAHLRSRDRSVLH
jgi:hypothetical protein